MPDNNLVNLVGKDTIAISSKEKPIIGTYALASCMAIIITDHKTYALAHILNDYESLIYEMVNLFEKGNLSVMIIPGFYKDYERITKLIAFLNDHQNFLYYDFNIELKDLKEFINPEFSSIEFAFDTRTQKFINVDYDTLLKEGNDYGRN